MSSKSNFVPEETHFGWLPFPPKVRDGAEDGIERGVQMFAEILGKETKNVAAIFLEERVLAAVAAVAGRIG